MRRRFFALWIVLLLLSPQMAIAQQEDDPNVTIHVVQRGENLFRIALNYGLTVEDVARMNGIINTANIQVGQRLLIPLQSIAEVVPPQEHTVQPGENLESIANAYGIDVATLVANNGITNPNTLYLGQVLVITPQTESVSPQPEELVTDPEPLVEAEPAAPVVNTDSGTGATVTVQSGDTLFRIATRYGLTVSELQQANGLTDPTLIYAGQELVIPGAEAPVSAVQLPPAITRLDIAPLTLTEGKTGRISLDTVSPATLSVTFLDRVLPVVSLNGNLNHIIFIGIPLETSAGIYPLTVLINEFNGTITEFATNIQLQPGGYGVQYISLPANKSELLAMPVEDNEFLTLQTITNVFTTDRSFVGPLSLPAAAPMNARFGSKRGYNGNPPDRFHLGADFAGASGTPVLAAASGRIVLSDALNIRGNAIAIDHGWGIFTTYSHLTERYVTIGEVVEAGSVIGTVGSTGRATGAHLHWEVWVNGVPVDPMQWVYEAFP